MRKMWVVLVCAALGGVLVAVGSWTILGRSAASRSSALTTDAAPAKIAPANAHPATEAAASNVLAGGCAPFDPAAEVLADGRTYVARFTGAPTAPASACGASGWDVQVHSRDTDTWYQLEAMDAAHGPDCGPPPATHHETGSYEEAVFQCKDHVMTSLKAEGYGEIMLTPDVLADFSAGTASVSWDISTLRESGRDWFDVWLTPFDENLPLPLQSWLPDLNGPPKDAVHVMLGAPGTSTLCPEIYRNFEETALADGYGNGCQWDTGYETILTPSAKVRTTFRIELSKTHIKVWAPPQPSTDNQSLVWFDGPIPGGLPFDKAVVQFGHHSYNPEKDDGCDSSDTPCQAGTWHWDNISVSPSQPFTIDRAQQRFANADSPTVTFDVPAPANGYLRFSGHEGTVEASFDGAAYKTLPDIKTPKGDGDLGQFFVPVPEGTKSVTFRVKPGRINDWILQDLSIWAEK